MSWGGQQDNFPASPCPNGMHGSCSIPGCSSIPGKCSIPVCSSILGHPSIPGTCSIPGPSRIPGKCSILGCCNIPGRHNILGHRSIPGHHSIPGTHSILGHHSILGRSSFPGKCWQGMEDRSRTDLQGSLGLSSHHNSPCIAGWTKWVKLPHHCLQSGHLRRIMGELVLV